MTASTVQTNQPSIGVPCFTKEYKPTAIPQSLQDEINALNAIYGDGTIEIAHAHNGTITTEVNLPGIDLPLLQLSFPVSYPQDPPEVMDFGVFVDKKSYRVRSARLIVLSVLQTHFVKGYECIFDLMDSCLPILSLLGDKGLNVHEAVASIPGFIAEEWLWTTTDSVNIKNVKAIETCIICFDEAYAFKMVGLPCKHYFCVGCFKDGWNVSLKSIRPFTCCRMRISFDMIATFNASQNKEIRQYLRMLQEQDTNYPFYCGLASCSALIGNTKECTKIKKGIFALVLCPKCGEYTCAKCRLPAHAGDCSEDKHLSALMDKDAFRRCPKCGQGIEKNGGCAHMTCSGCGANFQWEANGAVTLWGSG